ncbi:MAG: hypothetical protein SEPTF4163_005638 [Sporothrix epigloea]
MAACAERSDDDEEYAIDGTEHSRDGYGNLVTVKEQREMLEEIEMLDRSMKAIVAERKAKMRAANEAAFSIPHHRYKTADEYTPELSDADRTRLLSRGDLQARAALDPRGLSRLERYKVLGWPAPHVVDRRIRAATRASGCELSTPAELFAKARREGVSLLTPFEVQLIAHGFSVKGTNFEDGDGDGDKPLLVNNPEDPANAIAYVAALKEEGADIWLVGAAAMQTFDAKSRDSIAKNGHLSSPTVQRPGQLQGGSEDRVQRPSAEVSSATSTGLGASTSAESLREPEPVSFSRSAAASIILPHSLPRPEPESDTPESGSSAEPESPKTFLLDKLGSSKISRSKLRDAVEGKTVASPIPDRAEAGRVIQSISDAFMRNMVAYTTEQMDRESFEASFYSIITSLCGFADRFTYSLPPDPNDVPEETLDRLLPPPPRLQLSPNPFGLHMSHDGRSIVRANRFSNELPVSGMQTPPWSAWSTTVPHRLVQPCQVNVSLEAYVAAVREWTEREEQAWNQHRAAQEAAQQKGQQQPEALPFFSTPPFWPMTGLRIRPFNLFYESVLDNEDAKSWPGGKVLYAKTRWEALAEDEKAVYRNQCEDRRRQAWVDSLTIST